MPAKRANGLNEARHLAELRGGKCLSATYINSGSPMIWECSEGHQWKACFGNIMNRKSWCPKCARGRRTAEQRAKGHTLGKVQAEAERRGGACLSDEYVNQSTVMHWRCAQGHEWKSIFKNIRSGRWCPVCGYADRGAACAKTKGTSIDVARKYAVSHRGECLSAEVGNIDALLQWRCAIGHEWAAPLRIKYQDTWCPRCRLHKSEGEVRAIFEELTGRRFPKKQGLIPENPRWELDGYCHELGIAFEYHGQQHYEYVPYFHRNGQDDLSKQRARDTAVEKSLVELDEPIVLIIVPYWLEREERQLFISNELSLLL